MGVIIGKAGSTINRLQQTSGCNIILHQDCHKVVITASSDQQLQIGVDMVNQLLGPRAMLSKQFNCPLDKAGLVIGKKGSTVRQIMQQSGCVIKTDRSDISSDGNSQIFYITGESEGAAERAITLIQQIVGMK